MNNDFSNTVLIFMFLSRMVGIIEWSIVFFILMEVVICKDARTGNTAKILSRPVQVRMRMFKHSLRSLFYKGSFILFICSLFAIISMISDLWLGHFPRPPYTWTLVSLFLPLGIILVYTYWGYELTLFKKFQLFIKDQHD